MYGYVYKSRNKINSHFYIGQKTSDKFDPNYYGSGTQLKKELKEYGKENDEVTILEKANSKEDLNRREKRLIAEFKELCGNKCINRAEGGEGGNVHAHDTPEEHERFVRKMTNINHMRCQSEEFKQAARERMIQKYTSVEERQRHSEKVRETWSSEELRESQSKRIKEYYKTHKKDNSYNFKPCVMELNGDKKVFESQRDLKKYLKDEYDVNFPNPKFKKLLDSSEPFIPFHKNKENLKKITGMKIYDLSESVETNGDECSQVGQR